MKRERDENMSHEELWSAVLQKIRIEISTPSYDTWFSDTYASIDDNVLTITAQNEFAASWLEERYKSLIFDAVRECTEQTYEINIIYPEKTPFEWPSLQRKENDQLAQFSANCSPKQTKELSEVVENHEKRLQELEEILFKERFFHKFIPSGHEVTQEKIYFDFDGFIEVGVDVDEKTFHTEFQDWLDSKGWSFVGVAKRPV